ncbi:MAG TPA: hypothetical protein DD723_00385 [Candidatus Omnitrophica bacterium]|nr:MAG: hypothetical protein A2Z81_04655 [Omnitrophica WOR_2 bacterium GWA2_45_18]OGX19188.1 MAG: hypothetical protein A2Y04_04525 [Omnitrophica WOR_2 bacterium GWC2_45_7]HBR13988.1 hypothetical protein [Candidatus Omnitrophota bacterium]
MKKILTIAVVLGLAAGTSHSHAASLSKSYKVSVTIPALIGVNIDAPDLQADETTLTKNSVQDTNYEEVIRDNRTMVVKTMVAK